MSDVTNGPGGKKGSVKLRPVMRRQDTLTTREILKVTNWC